MLNNAPHPQKKSCLFEKMSKKYCRAVQATDDNIIGRMRIARRITKAIDIHSEYVTALHCNNGNVNAPSVFRYSDAACLVCVQPVPELVYFPIEIKRPKREATRSEKLTKW
jgi:hypothetical protein